MDGISASSASLSFFLQYQATIEKERIAIFQFFKFTLLETYFLLYGFSTLGGVLYQIPYPFNE
jgi:hypothetical protein